MEINQLPKIVKTIIVLLCVTFGEYNVYIDCKYKNNYYFAIVKPGVQSNGKFYSFRLCLW